MILQAQLTGEYVTLFLSGVGVLVFLSVMVVAFFVVYQRRLFAQERLRLAAEHIHQQQLLSAAVAVQETERKRIAGDLHDEIGSLLTATRLYLRQLTPGDPIERLTMIRKQSLEIIDDMIQNTRRISHDLLPPALEKFGLQAATEDLCERFDKTPGIRVELRDTTQGTRLPREAELGLYRVVQELLNNSFKHARASLISVGLAETHRGFQLTYSDDGRGFDADSLRSKGLGLRNIESRVSIIGGTLDYRTAPGKGLQVTIQLPRADHRDH